MLSNTMEAKQLEKLISQTSSYDKDERYMATNDICNLFQKGIVTEENLDKKVCAAVLKQLGTI